MAAGQARVGGGHRSNYRAGTAQASSKKALAAQGTCGGGRAGDSAARSRGAAHPQSGRGELGRSYLQGYKPSSVRAGFTWAAPRYSFPWFPSKLWARSAEGRTVGTLCSQGEGRLSVQPAPPAPSVIETCSRSPPPSHHALHAGVGSLQVLFQIILGVGATGKPSCMLGVGFPQLPRQYMLGLAPQVATTSTQSLHHQHSRRPHPPPGRHSPRYRRSTR